jgi:hypothetical protein
VCVCVCVCVLVQWVCVVRGNVGCYLDRGMQVLSGDEYWFVSYLKRGRE